MDGIRAMEGNGPRGGTPKQMNLILFSEDPVALDATVCRLIDLNPLIVPTIKFGKDFEAGTHLEEEIDLIGDSFDLFKTRNFDVKRYPVRPYKSKGIKKFFYNRILDKPYILKDRCVMCGICVQMCPATPKAVNWLDGDRSNSPVYNYEGCIRCYCCQELCPERAVKLKQPLTGKLLKYILIH